jgi:hypothetical protein
MKTVNVIPAKAGIQCFQVLWPPAFAGVTVLTNEIFLKLTALGPTRPDAPKGSHPLDGTFQCTAGFRLPYVISVHEKSRGANLRGSLSQVLLGPTRPTVNLGTYSTQSQKGYLMN